MPGSLSPSLEWSCGFKEQRVFWNPAFTGTNTRPVCCRWEKTGTQNVSFGLRPASISSCTNVFPHQMQWCWKLGKHAFTVGCFVIFLCGWWGEMVSVGGNLQSYLHAHSELVHWRGLWQLNQVGSKHLNFLVGNGSMYSILGWRLVTCATMIHPVK